MILDLKLQIAIGMHLLILLFHNSEIPLNAIIFSIGLSLLIRQNRSIVPLDYVKLGLEIISPLLVFEHLFCTILRNRFELVDFFLLLRHLVL